MRRAFVVALVLAACLAPAAHADGDPASDYLFTTNVFVPSDRPLPTHDLLALQRLVRVAQGQRYQVKVALIATPYDLGSITSLWAKPGRYARFLGFELSYVFHGTLLVVMPQGYGVYHHGASVQREERALARLPAPGTSARLAAAASTAVARLAAARGVKLSAEPGRRGPGTKTWTIAALVAALAGAVAILLLPPLRSRTRRRTRE